MSPLPSPFIVTGLVMGTLGEMIGIPQSVA